MQKFTGVLASCLLAVGLLVAEGQRAEIVKISVDGMRCKVCATRVEKALKKIEQVKSVVVALEDKRADVTITSAVPAEKLVQAIADAGYRATIGPISAEPKKAHVCTKKGDRCMSRKATTKTAKAGCCCDCGE